MPWLAHCGRPSQPGYTRAAFLDCFAFAIPCQDVDLGSKRPSNQICLRWCDCLAFR